MIFIKWFLVGEKMSNQASKVIGKEYIDDIRKIDDAVANILSKLDVAASSSTTIAVDNDGNNLN